MYYVQSRLPGDGKVCLLFSLVRFIVALSDVNLEKTAGSFIYLLLKRATLKQWLDVLHNLFCFIRRSDLRDLLLRLAKQQKALKQSNDHSNK